MSALIIGLFILNACSSDDEMIEEYPSLRLVNLTTDNRDIASVSLVGYEFDNLSIAENESQTFELRNGMLGGYEKINVEVRLSGPQIVVRNIEVNFSDGDIETISVYGCISYEGCNGYYVEYD